MNEKFSKKTDEIEASKAPLISHLIELRDRLKWAVFFFFIAFCICYYFANTIYNFLVDPLYQIYLDKGISNPRMIYTALTEAFFTYLKVSFYGALFLSFPILAMQVYKFAAPGLYKNEKKAFLPFLIASPLLFLLGAAFSFYIVMPLAFDFFLGFQQKNEDISDLVGITYLGTINEYLGLTMKFIIAFGLCFQLPVLLTLMGKAGLVSSEALAKSRKYAVVGILVLAAIVTPPDVITQIILFTVVYALYEISVILVKWVEKKKKENLDKDGFIDEKS